MARRASELTGIEVKQMLFENLLEAPLHKRYDAIWCCSSWLHLERNVLPPVLAVLLDALVSGGVMYLSPSNTESRTGSRMAAGSRI